MTPISGKLSDIYGKKKILLVIMSIYIIGVALGGFANNILFMIIARILQGIGLSMFPISFWDNKVTISQRKTFNCSGNIYRIIYFWLSNRFSFRRNNNLSLWMALCTFIYGTPTIVLILIVLKFIHIREEQEEKEKEKKQRNR